MNEPRDILDRHGDSVKGKAFGFPFEIRGPVTILAVILIAVCALIVWQMQMQGDSFGRTMALHMNEVTSSRTLIQEEHHMLQKQHAEVVDLLQAQLYITCQTNPECRKFDLAIPRILREMRHTQ